MSYSYEMHIGSIKLLDYYGGYQEVKPDDYFAAWLVLEEMKSDPCLALPPPLLLCGGPLRAEEAAADETGPGQQEA